MAFVGSLGVGVQITESLNSFCIGLPIGRSNILRSMDFLLFLLCGLNEHAVMWHWRGHGGFFLRLFRKQVVSNLQFSIF